jgi:hypothetical protein
MRVELDDNEGNRYAITFEGRVTREKALRLLELVELLGGVPASDEPASLQLEQSRNGGSKYSKVSTLISKHLPMVWFSSRELQSVYEQELKQPISLSTVATYLARMATRRLVIKTGPSNNLRYKLAPATPEITVTSQSFSQSI